MSNVRSVQRVIDPQYVIEGAGVLLRRAFGPHRSNLFDPFLLFDHFAFNDPREGPILGFPTHPHRGIETVTYMLEGNVRHRDSLGNVGVIGPGDVPEGGSVEVRVSWGGRVTVKAREAIAAGRETVR